MEMRITAQCKNVLNAMKEEAQKTISELTPLMMEAKSKGDVSENAEYEELASRVGAQNSRLVIITQMLAQPTSTSIGNFINIGKTVRIAEASNYADEPRLTLKEDNYELIGDVFFNRNLLISDIVSGFDSIEMLTQYGVISPNAKIIEGVLGKSPGTYEVYVNPQLKRSLTYEIL